MTEAEEESELCYATLAFQNNYKSSEYNTSGLPLKLLNKHNSWKELWSARRLPPVKVPHIDANLYKDDEEETLSTLPSIKLYRSRASPTPSANNATTYIGQRPTMPPELPPPRSHTSTCCQTNHTKKQVPLWKEAQMLFMMFGLGMFIVFAGSMNVVVWKVYIKEENSNSKNWCISLQTTGKHGKFTFILFKY